MRISLGVVVVVVVVSYGPLESSRSPYRANVSYNSSVDYVTDFLFEKYGGEACLTSRFGAYRSPATKVKSERRSLIELSGKEMTSAH